MKSRRVIVWSIVAAVIVCGAFLGRRGSLIATARLTGPGVAEASFPGGSSPLALWADVDGKWRGVGDLPVSYAIQLFQAGKTLGRLQCSTGGVRVRHCGVMVELLGTKSGACENKLGCELPKLPPGEVTARVTATLGPGVDSVKNVSLNFRSE